MAAPMKEKLSKSDRKLQKKQARARLTLMKHDGIETTDEKTTILCVNNAGLDNGVSKDEVYKLFRKHGSVSEIIMLPKKPYAFVCFNTEQEAEGACIALNGKTVRLSAVAETSVTLYISYVSKVPQSLSPCNQLPPGLILLQKFITEEYEQQMLAAIDWEDSSVRAQQKELKHRKVKHYGYEFKYGINNVDPDDPLPEGIPAICDELLDKALSTGMVSHRPDQMTINQYQPGQGIPPHVDTPSAFEDGLMSLSLGSQVVMDFRHPDGHHLAVLLPPRSLMVMTGESRYIWSHGITPRKSDIVPSPGGGLTLVTRGVRTSFTFRTLTVKKPEDTDSQRAVPKTENAAVKLEQLHVHQVYEEIAGHFSGTRHTAWPRIVEFLNRQPTGALLADIGCGNGKYLGINKGLFEVGSDRSRNLAEICQQRNFQVFVGDVLAVPLRENSFDVCLCIAVIHHLSTHKRRCRGISELLKILRPGGQLLIYVWAMEQKLNKVKSKYLKNDRKQTAEDVQNQCENQDDIVGNQGSSTASETDSVSKLEETFKENGSVSDQKNDTSDDKICDNVEADDSGHLHKTQQEMVTSDQQGLASFSNDSGMASCSRTFDTEISRCRSGSSDDREEKLSIHINRTEFKQQDLLVPWQLKGQHQKAETSEDISKDPKTFHRFYHVFKKGELEALCSELQNCKILDSYYDQGNWAVILEKC